MGSEIGSRSGLADHFKHRLALIETPRKWGFVKTTQASE